MDRLQRLYKLHSLLKGRRTPLPRIEIERALECSEATALRVVNELRNYGAPVEFDREFGGYRLTPGQSFELPGLWFTAEQLYALMTLHGFITQLEPGIIQTALAPLSEKLNAVLAHEQLGAGEVGKRVRVMPVAGRGVGEHFAAVLRGLIERQRLNIDYRARTDDVETERKVSPQRLTHYRDNWYLEAYCHKSRALRTFALDRIQAAKLTREKALEISEADLTQHLGAGFGIFAGAPAHTARIAFSAHAARWVADERWHPEQVGQWRDDGRYELAVPYANDREILREILKYGPDAEVLAPPQLRDRVEAMVRAAAVQYA
jgi:predicted DNA-binding transcriptional regulator YafY